MGGRQLQSLWRRPAQPVARTEQWDEWSGECDAAVSLLDEILSSPSFNSGENDDDRAVGDEKMVQTIFTECQTAATALVSDSKRYELELLHTGIYDPSSSTILLTA